MYDKGRTNDVLKMSVWYQMYIIGGSDVWDVKS